MRGVAVATAAVLAVTGLAGCRTNVGVAATVEGHRITESDVNQYVTAKSQPLKSTSQSGATESIAPRPFVLNILIKQRLYLALLRKTPKGVPSDGEIAAAVQSELKGRSYRAVAEGLGVKGYTSAFDRFIVQFGVLGGRLDSDVQSGVDVSGIAAKLKFPVSVNPRYGTWNPKQFNLTSGTTAGLPSFVTLQPTG
jgi:hypothetical protein